MARFGPRNFEKGERVRIYLDFPGEDFDEIREGFVLDANAFKKADEWGTKVPALKLRVEGVGILKDRGEIEEHPRRKYALPFIGNYFHDRIVDVDKLDD
tara:strand:- start:274 stop:570 length:297 start_codon:yes stop_codon:yes gene_type:complete